MRRKISWLLTLLMVASLLPAGSVRAEESGWRVTTPSITDQIGGYQIVTSGSISLACQADYANLLGNFWILDKQYEQEWDENGNEVYTPVEDSEYIREPLWENDEQYKEIKAAFSPDGDTFTLEESNRTFQKKKTETTGEETWSPSGQSFSRYSYVPIEFEVLEDRKAIASRQAFYTLDFDESKRVVSEDYIISVTQKVKMENKKPFYFSEAYVEQHPDWMYEFAKIQGLEFSCYDLCKNELIRLKEGKQVERVYSGGELLEANSFYADRKHTPEELKKLGIPEEYIAEDNDYYVVEYHGLKKEGARSYIRHKDRNGHRAVLAAYFDLPFADLPENIDCCYYGAEDEDALDEYRTGCYVIQDDIVLGDDPQGTTEAEPLSDFPAYEDGKPFQAICELISSSAVTRVEPDAVSNGAIEITSFGGLQMGTQYFPVKNVKDNTRQPGDGKYSYIDPVEDDGNVLWIPYQENDFTWPNFSKWSEENPLWKYLPVDGLRVKDSRKIPSATAITAPAIHLPKGNGILVNNDKRTLDFSGDGYSESEKSWYFNPSQINRDQTIYFGAAIPELSLPDSESEEYIHYRDSSAALLNGTITGGGMKLDWTKAEIRNNGSPIIQMYIELTGSAIQTSTEPMARLMSLRPDGYSEADAIDVKKIVQEGKIGTKIPIGDVNVKSITLTNLEGTGVDTVNIYAENSVGISDVPLFVKTNIDSNNYDPANPKPSDTSGSSGEPPAPGPSAVPVIVPGGGGSGSSGSGSSGSGSLEPVPDLGQEELAAPTIAWKEPFVTITHPDPAVTIHYKLDDAPYKEYGRPFKVVTNGLHVVTAYATKDGKRSKNSQLEFEYWGNPDEPVIQYDYDTCMAAILGPEGATLMYRIDDGTYAVYNGPFELKNVKDYTITSYAVRKEKKSREVSKDIFLKPATPLIKANELGKVTLTCATKGADIIYSTDDSTWVRYGKPFQVKNGTKVTAYAVRKEISSDKASKVILFEKEKEIRLTPYMTVYKTIYSGSRFKVDMVNIGKSNRTEWTVEDTRIASVSKKGIITAKKPGKTVVSCISTNNGKQYYRYYIVVTVPKEKGHTLSDPQPANQKFRSRMPVLRMRKILYPDSKVLYGLKNVKAADSIQYSTSDSKVAVIDSKGVVRPRVKSGDCYVTAKMKFHGQVYYFRLHIVIHAR